ncbi:MAG: ABC transporter substrate-binding protein [Magnetovibrio sp.]|nr:ABC transporter substrate-binding protein [Magnetovibrio sp.]
MIDAACAELLSPGSLRVGINKGNILLVTGEADNGDPEGIAPDMGRALAEHLGVEVYYQCFSSPGEVADAAERQEIDVGLIAEEPKRAEVISFCDPYLEIEATYLVPAGSPLRTIDDVDAPGIRIAVSERAAYDLYLSRTLQHATLHRARGLPGAFRLFIDEKLDALAGLVPALEENAESIIGARVIPGRYTAVQQAIGTLHDRPAMKAAVQAFLRKTKSIGFVAELIDKHGVTGKLQVAK